MGGVRIHFRVFLRIHDRGDGDTEVGDWAPEIYMLIEWISNNSIKDSSGQLLVIAGKDVTYGSRRHN